MEAKSIATGGTSNINSATVLTSEIAHYVDGGQPTPVNFTDLHEQRHLSSGANVEVQVRNFSGAKDTLTLEWYFFAYPVGTTAGQVGGKEMIFDEGSHEIIVPPKASSTWVVESKEMHSTIVRNSTSVHSADSSTTVTYANGQSAVNAQTQYGWIMKGWCVRLVDAGRVVAARGSSQRCEDLAKDDTKLKDFLRP